jgi:hypothetical protein
MIPFLKSTCMYMYGTYQNLITTLFEGMCVCMDDLDN